MLLAFLIVVEILDITVKCVVYAAELDLNSPT